MLLLVTYPRESMITRHHLYVNCLGDENNLYCILIVPHIILWKFVPFLDYNFFNLSLDLNWIDHWEEDREIWELVCNEIRSIPGSDNEIRINFWSKRTREIFPSGDGKNTIRADKFDTVNLCDDDKEENAIRKNTLIAGKRLSAFLTATTVAGNNWGKFNDNRERREK